MSLSERIGLNEPLGAVLKRLVSFSRKSGAIQDLNPGALPAVVRIALSRGLDVRTVHAIQARSHPHRIAVVDDAGVMTYDEINRAIDQVARFLTSLGVRAGDRVMICLENRTEYLLAWFALFRLGAATIHASYRSTSAELEYLLEHSRAVVTLVSAKTREAARTASAEATLVDVDEDPGYIAFGRYREFDDAPVVRSTADGAGENVVYTSGTTGKPKGAMRDFASFGFVELSRLLNELPVRFSDRHLVVCPLYHSAAQAFTLIHSALGATIYLHPSFEPRRVLETLHNHRINSMFMVPTMTCRFLDLDEETRERLRPPAFRMLISGAAAFPHALRKRAIEYFGEDTVYDFYGATELGWVTLISGSEMVLRPASVGRALPGQSIQIMRDGEQAPAGEVGTIYIKNAQTMAGYIDDRKSTEASTVGDWMTVDDLGYLDSDGYLYLAGRNRDMVISGGVNIYPVEIEETIALHPGVQEVAVIGIPHDEWGEEVVAVFAGDAEDAELEQFTRERLSGHKVPRKWIRIGELPRNPTGKVLKRKLREEFGDHD